MKTFQRIKRNRLYKTLFGYDVFISYSRKDSLDYAYQIAKILTTSGYEPFIDQLSSISPGDELPKVIKRAVINSTAMIIIGSDASKFSDPIDDEIRLFMEHKTNNPLVLISIDGQINDSAKWYNRIKGLPMIEESLADWQNKEPSNAVNDRILNALKFTKKNMRIRKMSLFIFLSVLFFTLTTLAFTNYRIRDANAKVAIANISERKASLRQAYSEKQAKFAMENEKNANNAMKIALQEKASAEALRDTAQQEKKIALREKAIVLQEKRQIEISKNEIEKNLVISQKVGTIENLKANFEMDNMSEVSDVAMSKLKRNLPGLKFDLCDTSDINDDNLSLLFLAAMAENFRSYDYNGNEKMVNHGQLVQYKDKIYIYMDEQIYQITFDNDYSEWFYESKLDIKPITFDIIGDNFISVERIEDKLYVNLRNMADLKKIVDLLPVSGGGVWRITSGKKNEFIIYRNTFENNSEWQFMYFSIKNSTLQLINEWKQPVPFDFSEASLIDSLLYFHRSANPAICLNLKTYVSKTFGKWGINPGRVEAIDPNGSFKIFAVGSKLYYSPAESFDSLQIGSCKNEIKSIKITGTDIFVFYDCAANADDVCVTFSSWKIPVVKRFNNYFIFDFFKEDDLDLDQPTTRFIKDADNNFILAGEQKTNTICDKYSQNCLFVEATGCKAYFWDNDDEFAQLAQLVRKDAPYKDWIALADNASARYSIVLSKGRWDVVDKAFKKNLNLNLKCMDGMQNAEKIYFSADHRFFYLQFSFGWIYRMATPEYVIEQLKNAESANTMKN